MYCVLCRELNDVRNANSDLTMECTKLRGEVSAEKVNINRYVHTHTHMHIYIVHVCMHIYIHTDIHAYAHACRHTHTQNTESLSLQEHCSQEIEKIKTNYWSQVKELNATIDDLVSYLVYNTVSKDAFKL